MIECTYECNQKTHLIFFVVKDNLCLVLPWVQNDLRPSKLFWPITNRFGFYPLVLFFRDLRNLQKQVKKTFCWQILFWPFIVWINCSKLSQKFRKFSAFSLEFQEFFSITRTILITKYHFFHVFFFILFNQSLLL